MRSASAAISSSMEETSRDATVTDGGPVICARNSASTSRSSATSRSRLMRLANAARRGRESNSSTEGMRRSCSAWAAERTGLGIAMR